MPAELAQQVIIAYAAGRRQDDLLVDLAERGYHIAEKTLRNLLAGRTYKELRRPERPPRAGAEYRGKPIPQTPSARRRRRNTRPGQRPIVQTTPAGYRQAR